MASICNDERATFGVMSGHERKTLRLSGVLPDALAGLDAQTLERLEQDLRVLIAALGADERGAQIPLSQM